LIDGFFDQLIARGVTRSALSRDDAEMAEAA
jgi:hypothetical protein